MSSILPEGSDSKTSPPPEFCGESVHPEPTERCALPSVHNGLHEPAERYLVDLRGLATALRYWRCCGAPNLCGAGCMDDELSHVLAHAERVVRKAVEEAAD